MESQTSSYYTADRGEVLVGVGILFIVLETAAFALRVLACRLRRLPFDWADVLAIAAFLSNMALVGMAICAYL